MSPIIRIVCVAVIFVVATVAWMVLGTTMEDRTRIQSRKAGGEVTSLWGKPIQQEAPGFTFRYPVEEEVWREVKEGGKVVNRLETDRRTRERSKRPDTSTLEVDLGLDQRNRGLIWYSLFVVRFTGSWTYTHVDPEEGELLLELPFPDGHGLYDDFTFVVDGTDLARNLVPQKGRVGHPVQVKRGQTVTLRVTYSSRGLDAFRYLPGRGVTSLERFQLTMTTDFANIDFPTDALSPTTRERRGKGWELQWRFKRVITSQGIGLLMPQRIQPGELAASLSFSAPVSLFFFLVVILLLSILRRIDIHPVNYLLLAAAFFAFHLLFSYMVDHISLVAAFVIASLVSVVLVVSYLRLVVSPRFAFLEAAIAQLVYLVGFALAHFWAGYTGLTVTVLVVLTLFLVMQVTGRLRWSEVLATKAALAKAP